MTVTTSTSASTKAITDSQRALDPLTPAAIERTLQRMHEARRGFPSGHEPDTSGDQDDDEDDEERGDPISYSDRTGHLALTGDQVEADIARWNQLCLTLWSTCANLAALHRRYGLASPTPQWCASCVRDGGRREPVAAGRYHDACRFCGESRSRNGGEFPPLAILRAHHLRAPITDQLIAANPQPLSRKPWKRPKATAKTANYRARA